MTRIKTKYLASEHEFVPHLWANKMQPKARAGSLYYDGDVIYSYGSHFPIARHITTEKGEAVLMSTRKWAGSGGFGYSTSQHQHGVRQAISHLKVIYCHHIDGASHAQNFRSYETRIKDRLDSLGSFRAEWKILNCENEIAEIIGHARDYAEYFGLELTANLQEQIDRASDPERIPKSKATHKKTQSDHRRQVKENKAIRQAMRQTLMKDIHHNLARIDRIIEHWREYGEWVLQKQDGSVKTFSQMVDDIVHHNAFPKGELLRVAEDGNGKTRVMTSKGMQVGVRCAREAFLMLRDKWELGDLLTYSIKEGGNMVSLEICGYRTRSMTESQIEIGCHTITRREIEGFANRMGWTGSEGREEDTNESTD